MGDIWGRRRIFLIGSAIFIITNILIGFLDNIIYIFVVRLIQGLGTAMLSASGLAIVATTAPHEKRSQYIAQCATAVYAGIACGPPIAGFIASNLGWQWLFWGSALAGMLTWGFMRFAVHEEWYEGRGEPFNWANAGVYALGMAALTLGSSFLKFSALGGLICIILGFIFITLYLCLETHASFPLLNVRLLSQNKIFALSSLAAFINYSSSFGMTLYFSLYLQIVRGMSMAESGLLLSLQFVVQAFASRWSGSLTLKYGGGILSAIGIALCGLGLLVSAFLSPTSSMTIFIAVQILLGIGFGLFAAPNTTVILESVDKAFIGQAASVTGTMRTCGALVNTAIITITLGYFLGDTPVSTHNIDAFLKSMRVDLIFFGVLNLIAIGFALGRQRTLKKVN